MSTRAELRALVKTNIGERNDKDTAINNALNLGLTELTRSHGFRALRAEVDLSTTVSVAFVTLPANSHKVLEARLINSTSSYPLRIRRKKWLVDRYPNPSADMVYLPDECYQEGLSLILNPIPNSTYTIRLTVQKRPAAMATDTAPNPVPELEYAVVAWATGYVWDSLEQFAQGSAMRSRAMDSLANAIRLDKDRGEMVQAEGTQGQATGLDTITESSDGKTLSGNVRW